MVRNWKHLISGTAIIAAVILMIAAPAQAKGRPIGTGGTGCLAGFGDQQTGECGAPATVSTQEPHHHWHHWSHHYFHHFHHFTHHHHH